jgi:hypothetical protein
MHVEHTLFQKILAFILLLAHHPINTVSMYCACVCSICSIQLQLSLKYFASLSEITVLSSLGELRSPPVIIWYTLYKTNGTERHAGIITLPFSF